MTLQFYSYIQVNKWSKNFHDKPHCRGIFHCENLMPHSTVSAAMPTGMLVDSMREISMLSPSKVPLPVWISGPPSNAQFLGPTRVQSEMASQSVQPCMQGSGCYRQAHRLIDQQTTLLSL